MQKKLMFHHQYLVNSTLKTLVIFLIILLYSNFSFASPLKLISANGNIVTLKTPVNKVISLAPNITELIFSIGGGNKLIGVDTASDYPPQVKNIAKVGAYSAPNLEKILLLKPDLILAWHHGINSKILTQFKKLGLQVLVFDDNSLSSITSTATTLYKIFNTSNNNLAIFQQKLKQLQKTIAVKPKVFLQIWHSPLMTLNQNTIFSEIVAFCGGENIFALLPLAASKISIEKILQHNPEIILISGGNKTHWQRWNKITAVNNHKIFVINSDLVNRATFRTIKAISKICHIISNSD